MALRVSLITAHYSLLRVCPELEIKNNCHGFSSTLIMECKRRSDMWKAGKNRAGTWGQPE